MYIDNSYIGPTNNDGYLKISGVSEGYHIVKASKPEYEDGSEQVYIYAGETEDVNLILETSDKYPRSEIIDFSGYEWYVRNTGKNREGPPNDCVNLFSSKNVWKDEEGLLHLLIEEREGQWYCAEVFTKEPLGYGKYIFYVVGEIDKLDKNVVFGMFNYLGYEYDKSNEIDIEFAKWGIEDNENSQFAIQDSDKDCYWSFLGFKLFWYKCNIHRFDTKLNGTYSTHIFEWKRESVFFQSLHGHQTEKDIIEQWLYEGDDIPQQPERVHINLYLFPKYSPNEEIIDLKPSNGEKVEIIIKKFEFIEYREDNNFNIPYLPLSQKPSVFLLNSTYIALLIIISFIILSKGIFWLFKFLKNFS